MQCCALRVAQVTLEVSERLRDEGGPKSGTHNREAEMGYEVDWETAVAASAPQIFALVADWSDDT